METSLTTLTKEEREILHKDREKMGGAYPSVPLIRLANKDMTQAPEGEYFTELRKGKEEEPEVHPIGKNPEIVILYKTNTYSYYTPEDGLIAWTSDIHGFGPLDLVTLYRKKDGNVEIDFDGVWPDFRKHTDAKYTITDPVSGKKKKLLKFRTVLYVLHESKPHKMFVSNASSAGVDANGNPSFDAPQKHSLQWFTDGCWNDTRAVYEYALTLDSQYIQSSKPYYIMKFTNPRELPEHELAFALRASLDAKKSIVMLDDMRKKSAIKEEAKPENIKPEDLPF